MKILVLGATGMAGHVITLFLKEQGHDITSWSRKEFEYSKNIVADINNLPLVEDTIKNGEFDAVINCIGLLNQDAEMNKYQAVFLNSYLPHYLSYLTKDLKTRIIHMSTDCVFSGEKGRYNENSLRDGKIFYDRTKALGELENDKDLTFRNSIIGPDINQKGIGLFNWFMQEEEEILGYTGAIWTGVTTLTLAKAMERAIKDKLVGVYHLVNNESISKYDLLNLFNKHFKKGKRQIKPNSIVSINKSLVNNRDDFDFFVPSYEQMIVEMKEWIDNHKELYPHYYN